MYAFGRLLWRARAGSRRTVAGCRPPPVDADHDLEEILANNKRWVAATNAADPTFFPKLAEGQSPQFLYVGCSDSRLVPNDMLGLGLGNLFVHRNVANLVVASDLNFLSVLTYAVEHLDVKHVLVTGHYDCGGVRAAMKNRGLGASSESVSPSSAKNEVELDELDSAAPMASTRCRAASTPSTRPSESLPVSGTVSRLRRSTQVINSEQKINLNLTPGRWRLRETAVTPSTNAAVRESTRLARELWQLRDAARRVCWVAAAASTRDRHREADTPSSQNSDAGVLDGWLTNIRDVSRLHKAELEAIDDFEQRHRRLVELNVVEQCLNVYKTAVVQKKRLETHGDPDVAFAYPRIHGLVFDPAEGILKKLPIDYTEQIAELGAIYDLFDWDQDHYMLRKASRLPSRPPRATKE